MNFGASAAGVAGAAGAVGAAQGTIAPEGGCPGEFFTSRKWRYENGVLVIDDFKGRPLARLSYSGNQFQGQDTSGGEITLSR